MPPSLFSRTFRTEFHCKLPGVSRRERNKAIIAKAKDVPCMDCGRWFPPEQMDFDHVRGVKVGNPSDMVGGPTHVLLAELEKCDPVCANDHRTRTLYCRLDEHVDQALMEDFHDENYG